MREDNLKRFFVFIFLLLPILVIAANYFIYSYVEKLSAKTEELHGELSIYGKQLALSEEKIGFYKEIMGKLDLKSFSDVPESGVGLFSLVQRHLTSNGVLSRVIDEESRKSPQGDRGVKISFEGPYDSFIRTLADWRELDVALRVRRISLSGYGDQMVKGDIVLETVFGK